MLGNPNFGLKNQIPIIVTYIDISVKSIIREHLQRKMSAFSLFIANKKLKKNTFFAHNLVCKVENPSVVSFANVSKTIKACLLDQQVISSSTDLPKKRTKLWLSDS